jgi:hypothetical protein
MRGGGLEREVRFYLSFINLIFESALLYRIQGTRDGKTSLVDYRILSFFCFRFF